MSEATRAPWLAKPVATTGAPTAVPVMPASLQGTAPGAGASLTRAPWATSAAGADSAATTRAPWAQGVSVAGSMHAADKLDFSAIAKHHPDYAASLLSADAASSASAAATPAASSSSQLRYCTPAKVIKTPNYLPLWKQTAAYAELTSFILLLNERVRGVKVKPEGAPSKKYSVSPRVQLVIDWLVSCKATIASIPPIQQSMRFGNKAFRTWHEQCTSTAALQPMLHALLGEELVARGAATELVAYLQDAFGSVQRIDYGTGHELNFVLWMCAVNKLGIFTSDDHIALVLEVFRHYILLMEELQSVYWLEPAGSKGAWGLDDYQFLVFLWGSSQLIGSSLAPGDILKEAVVDAQHPNYLFLLAIKFIHKMKSGPFYEHSAFLHQISGLAQWQKANSGLVRMYEDEVLSKFPIVQHVLFGRMLQFAKHNPDDVLGVTEALKEQQAKAAASTAAAPPVPAFGALALADVVPPSSAQLAPSPVDAL